MLKRKLRDTGSFNKGRSTGHMERTNMNVYNHVQSLHHADMENQIKKINQMVADGDVSKETGDFLKKQVK